MITRVVARLLHVPLPATMHAFGYRFVNVPFVEVHDDDGRVGTGFTYTLDAGAAVVGTMVDEVIAPALVHRDADDWDEVRADVLARTRRLGATAFVAAVSAVDIAVWDLRGLTSGLPLFELLHGRSRDIPFYGSGRSGQGMSADELVQNSGEYLADGFDAVKLSVGALSPDQDVARVRAVRDALGADARLMVDASERLTFDAALALGRQLDETGLVWFEEPLLAEDVDGYSELSRLLRTPIATGEHFQQAATFARYARETSTTYFQPDAALGGGVTEMLRVASIAEGSQIPLAWHSIADLHIHLASSTEGSVYVEDFPILERIIADPLRPAAGVTRAPDRPGHGIIWDAAAIEAYTVAS